MKKISPLSLDLWSLKLAGCKLQGGGSEPKHKSPHQLFVEYLKQYGSSLKRIFQNEMFYFKN